MVEKTSLEYLVEKRVQQAKRKRIFNEAVNVARVDVEPKIFANHVDFLYKEAKTNEIKSAFQINLREIYVESLYLTGFDLSIYEDNKLVFSGYEWLIYKTPSCVSISANKLVEHLDDSKLEITAYIPDKWEDHLNNLYNHIPEIKRREAEEKAEYERCLRKNFGL